MDYVKIFFKSFTLDFLSAFSNSFFTFLNSLFDNLSPQLEPKNELDLNALLEDKSFNKLKNIIISKILYFNYIFLDENFLICLKNFNFITLKQKLRNK